MSTPIPKHTNISVALAVTANRLSDGAVVYLTDQNDWSGQIGDCQIAGDRNAAENLPSLATALSGSHHVIGQTASPERTGCAANWAY